MGRDLMQVDARATAEAVTRVTGRLEKMAAALGAQYTAVLALPTEESRKLTYFDGGTSRQPARPVFAINQAARDEVITRVRERFAEAMLRDGTEPSLLPVLTVGANALRAVFVRRLETSGGDTPFAALSPAYAARKRRAGLDSRIGVARGLMLAAVKRAQVVVRKT